MLPAFSGEPAVDLRRAFRPAANSVWVITSAHDGVPVGFTAISIVSVSLDPPLVSFNISRRSSSLPTLTRSLRFAAHLLGSDQDDVAHRFAASSEHRFADPSSWTWDGDGIPALRGVLARASGRLVSLTNAGDSVLALGLVADSDAATGEPLLHHQRSYLPLPRSADLAGALS